MKREHKELPSKVTVVLNGQNCYRIRMAIKQEQTVDIFQIRFPLLTKEAALQQLLDKLTRQETTGVCFADMSTLNLAHRHPHFHQLLQTRLITLNDGIGIELIARFRGKSFPDNLNGTDLTPAFLARLPAGTRIFLIGGASGVAFRSAEKWVKQFQQLDFVGTEGGYFNKEREKAIVAAIRLAKPNLILVGLGNPLQVEFIARCLSDPTLKGMMWWAIGGLLDFYGSTRIRAPQWMINFRLEWLHIIYIQPHKLKRYILGIPQFLWTSLCLGLQKKHDKPLED